MQYGKFIEYTKSDDFGGAFLLYGDEKRLIEKTVSYLSDRFVKNFRELNYNYLHGDSLSLDDFYSSIETLPFMNDKRLVVLDELNEFMKRFSFSETFYDSIKNLKNDTILIFIGDDIKKTSGLYKFFKKNKREVEFNKLNNRELVNYINRELKNNSKSMREIDINYFIMLSGYFNKRLDVDLYHLESELNKLINASDEKAISREDIDNLIEKQNDSNIFNLLDSLMKKNSDSAVGYLFDLYEKDETMMGVLYMIQRRFRLLYKYNVLASDGESDDYIKKILNISDYEYRVIKNCSKNYSTNSIRDILDEVIEIEGSLKSVNCDELLLLQYTVVKICSL